MCFRAFRLSKKLYNEKGRPPYPYQSAKSRDLCVAFCTSQGRGAPLVRWPDGHTFFGPVSGRPYFLCFSAYNRPGAGAQYGSGGTPPAPCKNSKKWPKPLFRHAPKISRRSSHEKNKQFRAYEMEMSIPCCVCTKISQTSNLSRDKSGYRIYT